MKNEKIILSTKNNLFDHVNLLRVQHINHIAAQDWTLDELDAFVAFVHDLAERYSGDKAIDQLYRDYLWYSNRYKETLKYISVEELEDPTNTWIDDEFLTCKLVAEDMAAELVLYSASDYVKNIYAKSETRA